jgi:4-methyl-5(b-hydroxyethyl)-thiazole monophosphate biosynthesis
VTAVDKKFFSYYTSMPQVLVPLAQGFEEIEAITIIDVLRRGGIDVITATLNPVTDTRQVTGSHQITITADTWLDQLVGNYREHNLDHDFDAIVLPGGPGTFTLRDDGRIIKILKQYARAGKLTAAVCAAPVVLSAAGLLQGKRGTSYPSVQSQLELAAYVTDAVVVDGMVVTSRGPGTVMAFALQLVAMLVGENIAAQLQRDMIVQ